MITSDCRLCIQRDVRSRIKSCKSAPRRAGAITLGQRFPFAELFGSERQKEGGESAALFYVSLSVADQHTLINNATPFRVPLCSVRTTSRPSTGLQLTTDFGSADPSSNGALTAVLQRVTENRWKVYLGALSLSPGIDVMCQWATSGLAAAEDRAPTQRDLTMLPRRSVSDGNSPKRAW